MPLKPTLLFVHGAWPPECWARVIPLMEAQHYKCVSVGLPSVNSNPHKRLEDDIQAVRTAIHSEISQGNDVVLVVHSYGGAVSISALKGLTQPKAGGVWKQQELIRPDPWHGNAGIFLCA